MLLKDQTAVVTGCNRGIGKAVLELFAENGANILACVREETEAFSNHIHDLEQRHSVTIDPVYFDLNDSEEVKIGVKAIQQFKKPVDILVNNAGAIFTAPFHMTSSQKLKEMFEINYFSQIFITQNISRIMMRQKSGSIVNLSSSAAIDGNEGRTAYASAKAAMITSTKVMAKELAAYNIRVNAIAPGLIETEMMRESTPDDALASTLQQTCMKRAGRPEEIANAVLFLCSNLSSYITGQVLRVDGGM